LGVGLTTPHRKKQASYEKYHKEPLAWLTVLNDAFPFSSINMVVTLMMCP
jgi:hypothetical protein